MIQRAHAPQDSCDYSSTQNYMLSLNTARLFFLVTLLGGFFEHELCHGVRRVRQAGGGESLTYREADFSGDEIRVHPKNPSPRVSSHSLVLYAYQASGESCHQRTKATTSQYVFSDIRPPKTHRNTCPWSMYIRETMF